MVVWMVVSTLTTSSVSAEGVGINLHSHTKLRQEDGAETTQQVQGKIQKNQGKLLEHMGNHMQCREGEITNNNT